MAKAKNINKLAVYTSGAGLAATVEAELEALGRALGTVGVRRTHSCISAMVAWAALACDVRESSRRGPWPFSISASADALKAGKRVIGWQRSTTDWCAVGLPEARSVLLRTTLCDHGQ